MNYLLKVNFFLIITVLFLTQVVEHGLGHLPFTEKQVVTPTGELYYGLRTSSRLRNGFSTRDGVGRRDLLTGIMICKLSDRVNKGLSHLSFVENFLLELSDRNGFGTFPSEISFCDCRICIYRCGFL